MDCRTRSHRPIRGLIVSKQRITQHKAAERNANKENAELKRENHRLQRQVARLQKLVNKLLQSSSTVEESPEAQVQPLAVDGVECPSCKGPLTVVTLNVRVLRACKACGYRKVDGV